MTFRPTEQQARAIRSIDCPLCVSAGAGSGKTRVLAERLVTAMDPATVPDSRSPAGLEEALVVTFTEKAAGELAERVRRILLERGLVDGARRIDDAWISTIHGMCLRILREHALDAGLDPAVAVISAVDAGLLRETVFEQLLFERLATDDELTGTYGATAVQEHAGRIYDLLRSMGLTPDDVAVEEPADPARVWSQAREALATWESELSSQPCPTATLLRVIASTRSAGEVLEGLAGAAPGEPRWLAREVYRTLRDLKLSLAVGGAKDTVSAIAQERAELLDAALRAVVAPLASQLLDVVRAFAGRYEAAKRDRGVLDFEDLQLRAIELLSAPDGPAGAYRSQFGMVMIDEFQDTNEVQAALADLLSDGDLCTVGDERQSIYSFRFADVEVFRRHTAQMLKEGADTVDLSVNFRSHPDVLAFVNAAFSAPELFGDSYVPLQHGREESEADETGPPAEPRVELLMVHRTGKGSAAARATEADELAGRLRALVESGVPQGDIVILLRAMTHGDEYAEALARHGLECLVVAGGTFFGRPEVEAVKALLRSVSNPLDDEALAAVLASDMATMSDDGLLRLRRAAGRGHLWVAAPDSLDPADADALGRVRSVIGEARAGEGRTSVAGVLHRAVEGLDFDLRLLRLGARGRHAYANVLKLARLADEFERGGGSGIRDFLERLAMKERFGDRESPASIVDEHVDAVRIMTVHAAKGLEFPVVALPELGRDPAMGSGQMLLERDGPVARLGLALPASEGGAAEERRSAWFCSASQRARARETEEEKRLLYVACTRARERLLLSGCSDLAKAGGDLPVGWLRRALKLDDAQDQDAVVLPGGVKIGLRRVEAGARSAEQAPPFPRSSAQRRTGAVSEETAAREPETPEPPRPETVSYSGIRLYERCGLRYLMAGALRIGEVTAPPERDPAGFGNAFHAAVRLLGDDGCAPPPERVAAVARHWRLVPDDASRLRSLVEAFSLSETCRRVHTGRAPSREVPFAIPMGGFTLVGRLDLLHEEGGRAVVLDYKTGADALGSGTKEALRTQASCYALAAFAGGASSCEVAFVGVEVSDAGDAGLTSFTFDRADEPVLRDEITTRATRLITGPFEPLGSFDPGICRGCPALSGICPVEARRSGRPQRHRS